MEKRLYRNTRSKMIAGVCSGLADYFSIDPVLVRLVFVILALHSGVGIIAYIILWIVAPVRVEVATAAAAPNAEITVEQTGEETFEATAPQQNTPASEKAPGRSSFIGGIILIVIGALFLLDNFLPHFGFDDFWPVVLIAVGAGMLWNSWPRSDNSNDEVAS